VGLGQFQADRVSLYANLLPAAFEGTNGNDCWGYVSPSGREYAIMGLTTKVAFVEITDPAHPAIIQMFAHTSSSWGDIKVYGSTAYAVTESNTGIQVFDMSNIDAGTVTLVRTITSPGRTHNLSLDTTSGFLYTCGSNLGTGTTTCFDLSNPTNPVQVGASSLTPVYMHDAQVVTYTSGPYAGRQIMFGLSENRGLDIYDVTNKSGVTLIKRASYPSVSYAHQGWLSADRKYFYLDDELDEESGVAGSRTRVFNVENLANASLVSTFESGLARDHNQYWRDGFLFQANYRSGLRIYDTNDNPTSPRAVGFFDTYPNSNSIAYNGAWSCYPFFPSGTVIISDIDRGLFIVNVRDALTRTFGPTAYSVVSGTEFGGSLNSLKVSDNDSLNLFNDESSLEAIVQLEGRSAVKRLGSVKATVESSVARSGLTQSIYFYRFSDNTWQSMGGTVATLTDSTTEVILNTSTMDYVAANGDLRARVVFSPVNDEDPSQDGWLHSIDLFTWTAIPYTP
jgi:choice-of-anchor B domain-containing protein